MSLAKAILIFGGAELQQSLIKQCNDIGLTTVVIDPDSNALCKNIASHFEIVGGNDFEGTCAIVEKYHIAAIITAATDKPLAMMARVAAKYNFPFYTEDTATISTDKFLMKEVFIKNNIPCAYGVIASELPQNLNFPVIIKPRDNSGSRGVIFCNTAAEAEMAMTEAMGYSKKDSVLIEEVIHGKEYSIESIHFNDQHKVIQITEKITTPFPYNVELGHIQPAGLSADIELQIEKLIHLIATSLGFNACASHTELKINDKGIFIIETSPRLGGDFITSTLVPLSTGINIEKLLIHIALNEEVNIPEKQQLSSAIYYFDFNERIVPDQKFIDSILEQKDIFLHKLSLSPGAATPKITNSINRYGYVIFSKSNRQDSIDYINNLNTQIANYYIYNNSNTTYQLLSSDDIRWTHIIKELKVDNQIHFTPEYHQLMEKNGDGKAWAIYIENDGNHFFYPFMLNKLEYIGNYKLPIAHTYIKSVYGYTGPIIQKNNFAFLQIINEQLNAFYKKEKVLFEFIRFNPFLNNQVDYNLSFQVDIHHEKDYIYVDLNKNYSTIHALYSKSFKNNINKAKRLKLKSATQITDSIWKQFCELYMDHMKNKKADEYYYFGNLYFEELRKLVNTNGQLFYILVDDQLIASTLFLYSGKIVYSHHSTRDIHHPLAGIANKLIHDDAVQFFKEKSYNKLMLGGGIGSEKEDSLLNFKLSISKDNIPFMLGKKIIDKENYTKYLEIWQKTYPELSIVYEKYIEKITKTSNNL